MISFKMSTTHNISCSRLFPPITWLSASGSKVRVLYIPQTAEGTGTEEWTEAVGERIGNDRLIEVTVAKKMAEDSLSTLRMHGFQREDIYRMLDKGPWILAFDVSKALPTIFRDLQVGSTLKYCLRMGGYLSPYTADLAGGDAE